MGEGRDGQVTGDMKRRTWPLLVLLLLFFFFEEFVFCGGDCGAGSALCHSPHCDEGCDRFRPSDTCRSACNLTQFGAANSDAENTLSCLNGCKMAANRFAQRITAEAILQSPRIIPESITDTAMSLLWRNHHGQDSTHAGTFYLQSSRVREAEDRQRWTNVQRINVDFREAIK